MNESADATLADRSAFMKIVYEEVEAAMADPASPLQGSAFWQARPSFFGLIMFFSSFFRL